MVAKPYRSKKTKKARKGTRRVRRRKTTRKSRGGAVDPDIAAQMTKLGIPPFVKISPTEYTNLSPVEKAKYLSAFAFADYSEYSTFIAANPTEKPAFLQMPVQMLATIPAADKEKYLSSSF